VPAHRYFYGVSTAHWNLTYSLPNEARHRSGLALNPQCAKVAQGKAIAVPHVLTATPMPAMTPQPSHSRIGLVDRADWIQDDHRPERDERSLRRWNNIFHVLGNASFARRLVRLLLLRGV
jgi:hypothetical protein